MIPAGLYLADTSAIARISQPPVRAVLDRLGRLGLLATCVTIDLEVLYSARGPVDYAAIRDRRTAGFVDLPLHSEIGDRARAIQAMLVARGHHRAAGIVDLLTAAIAEHHAATVLHYDADFDHISAVTGQFTQWIAPCGSLN